MHLHLQSKSDHTTYDKLALEALQFIRLIFSQVWRTCLAGIAYYMGIASISGSTVEHLASYMYSIISPWMLTAIHYTNHRGLAELAVIIV